LPGGKADERDQIGERLAGFEGFHPVAVQAKGCLVFAARD
jgi:hypothetical protein